MPSTVADARLDVPLRNAKADLLSVQFLNPEAGEVLDQARGTHLEPKQMADTMGISHSLVCRGLKGGELSFGRLWKLDDDYWMALLIAIATKRRIAQVRTTIDIGRIASVLLLACALTGCASTTALRVSQVSFAAAQVLDVHSTHQAIRAGAVEANPLLPTDWRAQTAVKAAETAGVMLLGQRLAREHPTLATMLTAAIASVYTAISVHNYRLTKAAGQ